MIIVFAIVPSIHNNYRRYCDQHNLYCLRKTGPRIQVQVNESWELGFIYLLKKHKLCIGQTSKFWGIHCLDYKMVATMIDVTLKGVYLVRKSRKNLVTTPSILKILTIFPWRFWFHSSQCRDQLFDFTASVFSFPFLLHFRHSHSCCKISSVVELPSSTMLICLMSVWRTSVSYIPWVRHFKFEDIEVVGVKIVHSKWLQQSENKMTCLYKATVDDTIQTFMQIANNQGISLNLIFFIHVRLVGTLWEVLM